MATQGSATDADRPQEFESGAAMEFALIAIVRDRLSTSNQGRLRSLRAARRCNANPAPQGRRYSPL